MTNLHLYRRFLKSPLIIFLFVALLILTGLSTALGSPVPGNKIAPQPSSPMTGSAAAAPTAFPEVTTGNPNWVWQNPLPEGDSRNGVSCPSATTCFVVGDVGTIYYTNDSGASWISGNSRTADNLYAVSCPTVSVCYATGSPGQVLKTTDGGATWSLTGSTAITSDYLLNISCPTVTTCYAGGLSTTPLIYTSNGGVNWELRNNAPFMTGISCPAVNICYITFSAASNMSKVYYTNNSGLNWNELSAVANNPDSYGNLIGISCYSVSACVVAGDIGGPPGGGYVGYTTDSGTTWSFMRPVGINQYGDYPNLWGISCGSTGNGTCYAGGAGVIKTTNGGRSWIQQSQGGMNNISCYGANTCVGGTSYGKVIFTTDGGQSWNSGLTTGFYHNLRSVSCANTSTCLAVGYGSVVGTTNGGVTWNVLPSSPSLNSISCVPTPPGTPPTCVGVGSGYDPTNNVNFGTIYRTTNGGATWSYQTIPVPDGVYSTVLYGVYCLSATNCTAVGYNGLVATFNGTTWSTTNVSGNATLYSILCLDSSTCLAGGSYGALLKYSSGIWTPLTSNTSSDIVSISCPSASACYGAGGSLYNNGNGSPSIIYSSNLTDWTDITPADNYTYDYHSISCPAINNCIIVGLNQLKFYNGTTWENQQGPDYNPNAYLGVSCPGTHSCFVVGDYGMILSKTLVVSGTGVQALNSLLAQINNASPGQTIILNPSGTIPVGGPLPQLPPGVSLLGNCNSPVIFDAGGQTTQLFNLSTGNLLKGLVITNSGGVGLKITSGKNATLKCVKVTK